MYQFGSHRNQKIVLYTKDSRLRASSRHGGQGVFLKFLSSIRRWGSPLGSVIFIVNDGERVIISAPYLNTTSFIGDYGSGEFLLL
jgi:hypothetical protein